MRFAGYALARLVMLLSLVAAAGCETSAGTGALVGTGVGAMMGRAAGRSPGAMLVGAGVGAMGGYLIGNAADRSRAEAEYRSHQINPAELQPLMGSTWSLTSTTPESARPPHASVIIDFRSDGILRTTRTNADGRIEIDDEFYRIVNNTLIVNDRDYIINGPFIMQPRTLTFVVGNVTSQWTRVAG
jgi:hypothetical protein